MPQIGVVILAHGSRGQRGIAEVPESLKRIADGVKPLLPPGVAVIGAALQFNHPTLEESVASLTSNGVQRIVIMPYFLFPGRHITEDIPQLVEKLKRIYPEIQFIMSNPLGLEEYFMDHVTKRIWEAAPELWSNTPVSPTSPEAIEPQSLEIVARLIPGLRNMSQDKQAIVKRVVHASGDPQIAHLVKFSPSAIASGINSILAGSPVFTDVQMVATGINSHLAEACGCPVSCAMDETSNQKRAKEPNITRAAAAMHYLGKKLNGAIVAIGNAPTALLSLLELIDNDGIKPALIIGMPVGFVQAKESKEELIKRDVPYITIVGTRGGSATAVATVNALLKMAVEKKGHGRNGQTR